MKNQKRMMIMDDEPNLETIEVLYNESVRQYDLSMNSMDGLNNKSIGIIAFNGTLLSLSSLSIVEIIKTTNIHLNIFLQLIILSYIIIVISTILAAFAFRVVKIQTLNPQVIHSEYYTSKKKDLLDQLCANVADDVLKNKEHSEKKSKLINFSIFFAVIGVISVCVSLIYGYYL